MIAHQPVSVIVPTHKRPKLVRRAIDAIVSQEFDADIEVIVVHDKCDPDKSLEVNEPGRTVRVVENDKRTPGLCGARNTGFDEASHQWIAFCDDDDEWLQGKLAAQFAIADESTDKHFLATAQYVHRDGEDVFNGPPPKEVTFDDLLRDRHGKISPLTFLMSRALVDEIGLIDEEIPGGYGEDYDWMLRCTRVVPLKVAQDPVARYHWHGDSFYFEKWDMIFEAIDYLIQKHPEFQTSRKGLARLYAQQSLAACGSGKRRIGLKKFIAVLKNNVVDKRVPVLVVVLVGLPANKALALAQRFGKGL